MPIHPQSCAIFLPSATCGAVGLRCFLFGCAVGWRCLLFGCAVSLCCLESGLFADSSPIFRHFFAVCDLLCCWLALLEIRSFCRLRPAVLSACVIFYLAVLLACVICYLPFSQSIPNLAPFFCRLQPAVLSACVGCYLAVLLACVICYLLFANPSPIFSHLFAVCNLLCCRLACIAHYIGQPFIRSIARLFHWRQYAPLNPVIYRYLPLCRPHSILPAYAVNAGSKQPPYNNARRLLYISGCFYFASFMCSKRYLPVGISTVSVFSADFTASPLTASVILAAFPGNVSVALGQFLL